VIILPPVELEDVSFPEKAIVVKTGVSLRNRSVFLAKALTGLTIDKAVVKLAARP